MSHVLEFIAAWNPWLQALSAIGACGVACRLLWSPWRYLGRVWSPLPGGESPDSLERAGRPVVKTAAQRKKDYKRYKKIRSKIEARGVIDEDTLWAAPDEVDMGDAKDGDVVKVPMSLVRDRAQAHFDPIKIPSGWAKRHPYPPAPAPPAETESVELLKGVWMQPLRTHRPVAMEDLDPGKRLYTELWCVRNGHDRYIDNPEARTLLERGTYWQSSAPPRTY